MMDPLAEVGQLLGGGSRVIVISQADVDLRPGPRENQLFLLKMPDGSLAAGGRGGGFGERRVVRVLRFKQTAGAWEKLFDTEDPDLVAKFEIPFHVARMPMTLPEGLETMGYGVVDPELVAEFAKLSVQP